MPPKKKSVTMVVVDEANGLTKLVPVRRKYGVVQHHHLHPPQGGTSGPKPAASASLLSVTSAPAAHSHASSHQSSKTRKWSAPVLSRRKRYQKLRKNAKLYLAFCKQ